MRRRRGRGLCLRAGRRQLAVPAETARQRLHLLHHHQPRLRRQRGGRWRHPAGGRSARVRRGHGTEQCDRRGLRVHPHGRHLDRDPETAAADAGPRHRRVRLFGRAGRRHGRDRKSGPRGFGCRACRCGPCVHAHGRHVRAGRAAYRQRWRRRQPPRRLGGVFGHHDPRRRAAGRCAHARRQRRGLRVHRVRGDVDGAGQTGGRRPAGRRALRQRRRPRRRQRGDRRGGLDREPGQGLRLRAQRHDLVAAAAARCRRHAGQPAGLQRVHPRRPGRGWRAGHARSRLRQQFGRGSRLCAQCGHVDAGAVAVRTRADQCRTRHRRPTVRRWRHAGAARVHQQQPAWFRLRRGIGAHLPPHRQRAGALRAGRRPEPPAQHDAGLLRRGDCGGRRSRGGRRAGDATGDVAGEPIDARRCSLRVRALGRPVDPARGAQNRPEWRRHRGLRQFGGRQRKHDRHRRAGRARTVRPRNGLRLCLRRRRGQHRPAAEALRRQRHRVQPGLRPIAVAGRRHAGGGRTVHQQPGPVEQLRARVRLHPQQQHLDQAAGDRRRRTTGHRRRLRQLRGPARRRAGDRHPTFGDVRLCALCRGRHAQRQHLEHRAAHRRTARHQPALRGRRIRPVAGLVRHHAGNRRRPPWQRGRFIGQRARVSLRRRARHLRAGADPAPGRWHEHLHQQPLRRGTGNIGRPPAGGRTRHHVPGIRFPAGRRICLRARGRHLAACGTYPGHLARRHHLRLQRPADRQPAGRLTAGLRRRAAHHRHPAQQRPGAIRRAERGRGGGAPGAATDHAFVGRRPDARGGQRNGLGALVAD